jgi:hypothetical protein
MSTVWVSALHFWPGRDMGIGEPASCAGGRENSVTLHAPSVFRLCLQVLKNVSYGV